MQPFVFGGLAMQRSSQGRHGLLEDRTAPSVSVFATLTSVSTPRIFSGCRVGPCRAFSENAFRLMSRVVILSSPNILKFHATGWAFSQGLGQLAMANEPVLVLMKDCQRLRYKNSDQPTAEGTLPIKPWPFLGCCEPTIVYGNFRFFRIAKHSAC